MRDTQKFSGDDLLRMVPGLGDTIDRYLNSYGKAASPKPTNSSGDWHFDIAKDLQEIFKKS